MEPNSRSGQTSPLTLPTRTMPPAAAGSCALALSVVIPFRNEAGNLAALHDQLSVALIRRDFEVIVVDDSDDEETRPLLRELCRRDRRWTVILRPIEEQSGLGTAVVAGIAAARGDAVCVMDGDLQHPPEIVPKLLAKVQEGADLAVASRYMRGGSRAGLAGPSRLWVSRACTWLAHLIFAETRRTSDPLTGFFCCRRRHVAGLELRPMGFKILLELLVCAPRLSVVDVPFVFAARQAGESKASTRQGVLFLNHLLSLFFYVPGSARWLKHTLVTGCGLAVFSALLYTLLRGGLPPIPSWVIAAAATLGCGIAFQQATSFRALARRNELDDSRFHYPFAIVASLGFFTLMALVVLPGRHALLGMAVLAQSFGVLLTAGLDHPRLKPRIQSRLPLPTLDLHGVARRLGAQHAFWVPAWMTFETPHLNGLGKLVTQQLVAAAGRSGQPALVVERQSARPQPRLNIETSSALIIPKLDDRSEIVAVAVLTRRGRHPFRQHDLDQAMAWIGSSHLWVDLEAPLVAVQ